MVREEPPEALPPPHPLPRLQEGLGGNSHGGDGVGQAGDGEGLQGVVDPLLRPADEVGLAPLQLHLPRGHGPGTAFPLEAAHPVVQAPLAVQPGQEEEGQPLGARGRPLGPRRHQGHIGKPRPRGEVLVPPVKAPDLPFPAGHGAVRPEVASPWISVIQVAPKASP